MKSEKEMVKNEIKQEEFDSTMFEGMFESDSFAMICDEMLPQNVVEQFKAQAGATTIVSELVSQQVEDLQKKRLPTMPSAKFQKQMKEISFSGPKQGGILNFFKKSI